MIGKVVSHYEIIEQLGGGGMGVVYRARDTKLDRPVALKFLPPELSRDEQANARFMQEAKAASALDHPNICTIYEVGEAEDGQLFIAMALYEGQTLKYRLKEGNVRDRALKIAHQIAAGLAAAHAKGIVHRDIKPANIMVQDDGLVKILDFGLAKLPGVLSLTKTGSTLGTAAYMSPEQIQGDEVDERSDLWALGVVLYEMMVGKRPFEGDYEQAMTYAILNKPVEYPDTVDGEAMAVLDGLLAKEADDRFESAAQAASRLERLLGSGVIPTGQVPTSRRSMLRPIALGSAIVLLLVAVVAVFMPDRTTPERASIDANSIAVMPFSVRGGPGIEYLGEGIVDLLSVKLDGAGELRSVDPNAVFGTISRDNLTIVTPEDAIILANRLEAGRTIVGSVTQAGSTIQFSAALYEHASGPLIEASQDATSDAEIPDAIDRLARQLIEQLLVDPDWKVASLATVATESFPALKAYLQGTAELRKTHWAEATELLREAVSYDSTFALAWNELARAYGWEADPRESEALEMAIRHIRSLPPRVQMLIQAHNYGFNIGDFDKAQELYLSILADYPNDTKALNDVGEMLFHYNPMLGRPQMEATEYLKRAAALAPDNSDYLSHIYDVALDVWDFETTDSLAILDHEISGREDTWEWSLHMQGIYRRSEGDSSWTITDPGSMNTLLMRHLFLKAATFVEDLEAAEVIADFMTEPGRYPKEDRDRMLLAKAVNAAGQGRHKELRSFAAEAGSENRGSRIIAESVMYGLPVFPASDDLIRDLLDQISGWDTTKYPVTSPLGYDVYDGEYDVVKAYLRALMARRIGDEILLAENRRYLASAADPTTGQDLAYAFVRSLDALEALEAGDFDEAIEAVDEARLRIHWRDASQSLLREQVADRFIKAEALKGRGAFEDAITVYRSVTAGDHPAGLLFIGPEYIGVADAYEQLGDIQKAIEFYSRFVRMWKNCDPELRPIRHKAEAELERLLAQSVMEPET